MMLKVNEVDGVNVMTLAVPLTVNGQLIGNMLLFAVPLIVY
ncbi:hypothetical protein FRUB_00323 [Fimbriiglobus ruber]|uniref:Uncharacterized protein n=1 Tax=Fimbriiglobus ruber TaxID=1908690 RepID=A0A225E4E3_9BACT|nr:hypothetical protein FRUB_00323 [Fimbriiglobus ruber]